MAKPFAKLRGEMVAQGLDQDHVGRRLLLTGRCINDRLNVRQPWKLTEMYQLMDLLGIPYEQMHIYFPCNGQNEPGCTRLVSIDGRRAAT